MRTHGEYIVAVLVVLAALVYIVVSDCLDDVPVERETAFDLCDEGDHQTEAMGQDDYPGFS